MSSSPAFVGTLRSPVAAFANADGTAFKSIVSAGASGSRIDTLFASNSDPGVATVLQLAVQVSGVDYVIGEVTVPLGAGTNGTAKSVSVLNPADLPPLTYTENGALYLGTGAVLRARCKVAIAGAYALQLVAVAGDY